MAETSFHRALNHFSDKNASKQHRAGTESDSRNFMVEILEYNRRTTMLSSLLFDGDKGIFHSMAY